MSVIVDLSVPSAAFELGRLLRAEDPSRVALEAVVPLGGRPTPFVRVRDGAGDAFEASARDHPSVDGLGLVDGHGGERLYAFAWEPSADSPVGLVAEREATLLEATADGDAWRLVVGFPSREAVAAFREASGDRDVPVTVAGTREPTTSDAGGRFGLTRPQHETLTTAVETGYYALPRRISTKELGERFDISDQAVTERLRRGISTLVSNALSTADDPDER